MAASEMEREINMAIRSTKEIYQVLEKYLREAHKPVTCVDLMDFPEVRATAIAEYGKDVRVTTNRVSDALGLMWRRGLLVRYPAAHDELSLARYAYAWDSTKDRPPAPVPSPTLSQKTGAIITEQDDGVLIEFEKFMVFVRQK